MYKSSLFLALFFLLGVSEGLRSAFNPNNQLISRPAPPKVALPQNITIETPTEILIYEPASTFNTPWFPLDPTIALNVLNVHNQMRSAIGLPLLSWSYQLEQSGWWWARNCVPAHDPNLPLNVGENIIALTSQSINEAGLAIGGSEQWMAEIGSYNCPTDTCNPGAAGPTVCGHFVQAIWNTTTHLGCSIANCATNSPFTHIAGGGRDIWSQMVCRYYPPAYAGEHPVSPALCPRIKALQRAGAIPGLPNISTGKGPLGPNVDFPTVPGKSSISTGAIAEFPK